MISRGADGASAAGKRGWSAGWCAGGSGVVGRWVTSVCRRA